MKHIGLLAVLISLVTSWFLGCGGKQEGKQGGGASEAETIATQQRLNHYFHDTVMPTLKPCWAALQGSGKVGFEYTYTREGAQWSSPSLRVEESSLGKGQDEAAVKCMEDAVRSTSFAAEKGDEISDKFVLSWTWPVPFPENAEQLTSDMFAGRRAGGGTSGGCDGFGKVASCLITECPNNKCPTQKVCVGFKDCVPDANGCHGFKCASGGPFGLGGVGAIQ